MEQVQQLTAQLRELVVNRFDEPDFQDKYNALQKQIADVKRLEHYTKVKTDNDRKRKQAERVWAVISQGLPNEDITTNSGSLHSVKAKKYPHLVAGDVRIQWDETRNAYTKAAGYYTGHYIDNGLRYCDTLEDFLSVNNIEPEGMTFERFCEVEAKAMQLNAELDAAIKHYKSEIDRIGAASMQYLGYFRQNDVRLYTTDKAH